MDETMYQERIINQKKGEIEISLGPFFVVGVGVFGF